MKLKYILPAFIAAVAILTTACDEDNDPTYLSEVQVSQSTVALSAAGDAQTITINASADWAFEDVPSWLTINPLSGSAGRHDVTFSAPETTTSYDEMIKLVVGSKAQLIHVMQVAGKVELPITDIAEVLSNGINGVSYRVKGVCTGISGMEYGNWYIADETGSVYIYGTLDKKGNSGKNNSIADWGIEVGDILTVEGPRDVYSGTIELVNVTVIDIEKSLVKVDSLSTDTIGLEGGDIKAYLTAKGNGLSVDIPEAAMSWLSVTGIETAGSNAVVTLHAAANAGGDRSTTLTFRTTSGGKAYTSETAIFQTGAIVDATVADFLAAAEDDTQYRLQGVIQKVANSAYGNVYLRDFSGEAYIYGIGKQGDFEAAGLKEGDIVTLIGKRASYKGDPQMGGAVLESVIPVTDVSIAEFLAKEDNKNVYYRVSGVMTRINDNGATYGNVFISDDTSELYVYGCYPGWGATGDARKNWLEAANITVGDTLTMIGYKDTYNGTIELCGGIYFSHEKPVAE